MKQAVPYFGRFLSKLVLEIIPGALVSVFAAYMLSMLHLGAEPATTPSQSATAVQNDGLSSDERRELTRQMLKDRRENPEEPAEVKPVPSLRPASLPSETADLPHPSRSRCRAAGLRRDEAPCGARGKAAWRAASAAVATIAPPPTTPLPRTPAPRAKTEAAAAPALPPAGARCAGGPDRHRIAAASWWWRLVPFRRRWLRPRFRRSPSMLRPVLSPNAPAGDLATQPQQRGIVGNIFSGVSTIAGGAANITGNTVNWVIDLPGKAISAGGKLLTGNDVDRRAPETRRLPEMQRRPETERRGARRLPQRRRRLRCR